MCIRDRLYASGSAQLTPAGDGSINQVLYSAGSQGDLRLVTVFLGPEWAGASVELESIETMQVVVRLNGQELRIAPGIR